MMTSKWKWGLKKGLNQNHKILSWMMCEDDHFALAIRATKNEDKDKIEAMQEEGPDMEEDAFQFDCNMVIITIPNEFISL